MALFNLNFSLLIKKIARTTRQWRIAVGWAEEPINGSPVLARVQARRSLPGGRLNALEGDIDHVINAWNQHIPQLLSGIGEARRVAAVTALAQDRMEKLEATVEVLAGELGELRIRLAEAERTVE